MYSIQEVKMKVRVCSKLLVLFFFFGWGVCSAQKRNYWDLQVGLGSYINDYDGRYANIYNPRGQGPEVTLLRGKNRKGLGYEYGLTYRHTAHQSVSFFNNDRIDKYVNAGFLLIPAFMTYTFQNLEPSGALSLKLRTGLYAGWMLYGEEYFVAANGTRGPNIFNGNTSRFPTFDAFGGQLGLKVQYAYQGNKAVYLEIRTILDASSVIHPNYVPYSLSFASYKGRLIGLGINF